MLLNGSWAVSDQPDVWLCVRSGSDLSDLAPNPLTIAGPELARCAQLGHLHEEIRADRPEERQAWRELVHAHAGRDAGANIFDAVGEGVG